MTIHTPNYCKEIKFYVNLSRTAQIREGQSLRGGLMVKNDRWIKEMAEKGMITPFAENQISEGVISYGISSYGYDMRIADKFKIFTPLERKLHSLGEPRKTFGLLRDGIKKYLARVGFPPQMDPTSEEKPRSSFLTGFTNINTTIVDPKKFDPKSFVDFRGDVCSIPPNSFVLATSVEYFKIPRETIVICLGKSTYARCGILVNVTPLEPEWEGHVTIEISNTTPLPAKIYANEGIAQLIFLGADEICTTSYADKTGKYQAQKGITLPKI